MKTVWYDSHSCFHDYIKPIGLIQVKTKVRASFIITLYNPLISTYSNTFSLNCITQLFINYLLF